MPAASHALLAMAFDYADKGDIGNIRPQVFQPQIADWRPVSFGKEDFARRNFTAQNPIG
ncbi:MAG: hypothetical protein VX293_06270 [Candidatus Latescibacterota bacterium]|nr:hypothetical protein [Candidatus Latescibacterota bacterium]